MNYVLLNGSNLTQSPAHCDIIKVPRHQTTSDFSLNSSNLHQSPAQCEITQTDYFEVSNDSAYRVMQAFFFKCGKGG